MGVGFKMNYVDIIEDAINYIEENLETDINLEMLAQKYFLSKFYYHRIFTAVMGITLKEYISKRKLNYALSLLKLTKKPMVEIALLIGYGSQESFIRAFKANYGVTPGSVRRGESSLKLLGKPEIVQRTFKNFNSDVITEFSFVEKQEIELVGFFAQVDLADKDIQKKIAEKTEKFLKNPRIKEIYSNNTSYSVSFADQNNSQVINTFFGIENILGYSDDEKISTLVIHPLLYAKFCYKGDMLFIGDTVIQDLLRWMRISKIEVELLDITFLQIYDPEYNHNSKFELYLPIHTLPQRV